MCRLVMAGLIGVVACARPATADDPIVVAPHPDRPVCGWKELEESAAVLEVGADGHVRGPRPGEAVLAISADPSASFEHVRDALIPYEAHLVRLDIAVDGRWLVPVTFAGRPAPPMPGPKVETIVGHRRLIRPRDAPRLRFADVRLSPDGVRLYVEHERVAGSALPLDRLAATLQALDPPATAFALTASDDTPWRAFVEALAATACFDRPPGSEPHEVLLDERPPPSGGN